MSEYVHCVSGNMETVWGEYTAQKDGLTGKFSLKGTSRGHLVQTAAPNKVNFKTLFKVLSRPVFKISNSTVSLAYEKDSRNWIFSLKDSSSVGFVCDL